MKSFHTFFKNKTSNISFLIFSPNDENICNRGISNPHLRAIQNILISIKSGNSLHWSWIRSIIWLCETETSNQISWTESWEIFLFLFFRTKFVNGVNDQWVLNTEYWTIGAVYSFNLTVDKSIRCVWKTRHTKVSHCAT